jgi:TatD DNase family protein
MWFDSHCHLNLPGFDAAPEAVWAAARARGVTRVFVPGTDPREWENLTLGQLPGVSTGVGLHPFTLEAWSTPDEQQLDAALDTLASAARSGKHVALGECGWDKPLAGRCPRWSLAAQTRVVEAHLRLAVELDLPVVLHVVQAHGLALDVLRKYPLRSGGIIHCFSGNAELVPLYCGLGFALGYGTQLLRVHPQKAFAALRVTPRTQLVVETDAPFRAGSVHQLENSPMAVVNVAQVVSAALALPEETVADITFENAARIFERAQGLLRA